MKRIFFGIYWCILMPSIVQSGVEEIRFLEMNKKLEKGALVSFHEPTTCNIDSKRPDLTALTVDQKPPFIARLDRYGIYVYFSLETNDDVNALVEHMQNRGGWDISWYYLAECAQED